MNDTRAVALSFEAFLAVRQDLETRCKAAETELRALGGGSGPCGLTPDSVKASAIYQGAKAAFDQAFKQLQALNRGHVNLYRKELNNLRLAKRVAK